MNLWCKTSAAVGSTVAAVLVYSIYWTWLPSDIHSVAVVSERETPLNRAEPQIASPFAVQQRIEHISDNTTIAPPISREQIYFQLLSDAHHSIKSVNRHSLKKFWIAAVDLKRYDEAIEALNAIIDSSDTDEQLIADAIIYRNDLLKLSLPQQPMRLAELETQPFEVSGKPPEDILIPAHESKLDSYRRDELIYALQGQDVKAASAAIHELSLHRHVDAVDALIQNIDYLTPSQYKKVLRTLWYSSADNIASNRIQLFIEQAQSDSDEEIAALANLAYADLNVVNKHNNDVDESIVQSLYECSLDPCSEQ